MDHHSRIQSNCQVTDVEAYVVCVALEYLMEGAVFGSIGTGATDVPQKWSKCSSYEDPQKATKGRCQYGLMECMRGGSVQLSSAVAGVAVIGHQWGA